METAVLTKQRERVWLRRGMAAAVPLAALGVMLAVCGIRYHTNDDATLANIAAGAYGPDRLHMVYVNLLFAALLRPLYALAGAVNWYVIVQLALAVLSCAALLDLAMEKLGTARGALLGLCVLIPFANQYFYMFQYTKNSGLYLAAGLVLVAATLGRPNGRTVLGVLLVLAGSMLRWENFYAIGGLSAPLLLGCFVRLPRVEKRRAAATMLALFALAFGAKGVDALAYRLDDGWREYTEYNAARTAMSDYADFQMTDENMFAAEGISDNDYKMLRRWDFYDGEVFPAERLGRLAGLVPARSALKAVKETAKCALAMLRLTEEYHVAYILLALAGLALLKLKKSCLPFYGTMGMLWVLVLYLQRTGRFPSYVEVPLRLGSVVFGLACMGLGEKRARPRGRALTGMLACVPVALALICAPAYKTAVGDSASVRERSKIEDVYFQQMSADKENLYLLSTESIDLAAGLDVWHPRGEGFFSNIVAYGGWLSHAPHREAALAAYGLERPLTDAVDDPRVYLSYHGIGTAARYAEEHLGRAVEAVNCGENAFAGYRLQTAEENAE